jgi:hypothetical protein
MFVYRDYGILNGIMFVYFGERCPWWKAYRVSCVFLLSFSCLLTFECVFEGGAPFPARAQLYGKERERGLLHQGHFCIFFRILFLKIVILNSQTTGPNITTYSKI